MSTETTHPTKYNPEQKHLYLAFELGQQEWQLGFTIGFGPAPRIRKIKARDVEAWGAEIEAAKKRFHLPPDSPVLSCYEVSRDGFWLHRYLQAHKIENQVVDSASIEVNRKARRAKTDRLDVRKLLTMRMRYQHGEQSVWSVVNVPSPEAEDRRQLHRDLNALTAHNNRIKGLLAAQGICLSITNDFLADLAAMRLWDGNHLQPGLRARLQREYQHFQFVQGKSKPSRRHVWI